ncbi:PKD domain-containing protein [Ferruginibacter sp.]|nr:PKD domain-containing protein [Ferruginibacter sp.]
MRQFYQKSHLVSNPIYKLIVTVFLFLVSYTSTAQCPPNIDFEMGDFTGWQCWVGSHYLVGAKDTINFGATPVAPTPGRHTMLAANPGNGLDPFGLFPQNCPNGSGNSILLGNTTGGHEAEGVSYVFTIPTGQNKFNITYNYAVVFQGPNHVAAEQPRLVIEVMNLTDNIKLSCSSFDFYYDVNNPLPGFRPATVNNTGTAVWVKEWASNSVDLDGLDGKTIQVFFKTADCIYTAHFGYAYVDVSTQCGSAFTGATFCPDDTAVTVVAPYGYDTYNWWNGIHTTQLGTGQSITLNPPPLAGDSLLIEVTPFSGYGCPATFKAYLFDTLTITANAGVDRETCDNNPVQLGSAPVPGRVYKWSPATGLSNPDIANPIATPSVTTPYTLTVTNGGGGCLTIDNVTVNVDILSDSIEQIGPSSYCTSSGQSVSLRVLPHDNIQWYRNSVAIPGANATLYNVTQTGAYYAVVTSSAGCNRTTAVKQIDIWESPVAGFTSNTVTQCSNGNQFIFTNASTLTTGVLQYSWNFGDGNISTARDVNYSYAKEGNYTVKLLVTAPGGCVDSTSIDVVVNPSPVSAFAVDVAEQCFKNNWFVFNTKSTVPSGILTYTWDFGDGTFDNSNDIAHRYLLPGTYVVKLTAMETNGGCTDDSSYTVIVNQSPIADFTINNNTQCFPGHQFLLTNGTTILSDTLLYTWTMGDGVINTAKDINYSYVKDGSYTIKLVAATLFGCQDSIVRNVTVHPTPRADFTIRPVCENLQVPIINRTFNNTQSTINYLWDFGNGHLDNVKSPVYSYAVAGTYAVKLIVSTVQCPVSFDTATHTVTIDAAANGIVYADKDAAFNFPEPLQARAIGTSVIWTPATNLDNRFSFTPVFNGITPQLYTIQIKTATGCLTTDTQLVKTHKKIEIYVPTGFTPGGDGINERLRPVLIGFSKVNYFRIYNRWGKMLFSMNSDQPGWDGKVGGQPAEMQTVVWMIEAVDIDGKVHNRQGTTVIIR